MAIEGFGDVGEVNCGCGGLRFAQLGLGVG